MSSNQTSSVEILKLLQEIKDEFNRTSKAQEVLKLLKEINDKLTTSTPATTPSTTRDDFLAYFTNQQHMVSNFVCLGFLMFAIFFSLCCFVHCCGGGRTKTITIEREPKKELETDRLSQQPTEIATNQGYWWWWSS